MRIPSMLATVNLIAQTALAALMGDLLLGRRLGRPAMAWAAAIACLPNLEAVLPHVLDTRHDLTLHHGPLHSLLWMILASAALAFGLEKLWRPRKITRPQAGLFAFAILSGHTLLECLSLEGAALLWPFSNHRFALNLLSPSDILFTLTLATTALWLAIIPTPPPAKKSRKKSAPAPSRRPRIRNIGLGLASAVILTSLALKWRTTQGFDQDLLRRGASESRRIVGPTHGNFFLWRAVIDRGDALWVGYRSVFESTLTPVRWTAYPRLTRTLTGWADSPEVAAVHLTTDGWWIARPHTKGAWIGDLRQPESRTWDAKPGMVDSRTARSWVFSADGENRLRQVNSHWNPPGTLGRMAARIAGSHQRWEANPRLAGVTGRFPEFLPTQE